MLALSSIYTNRRDEKCDCVTQHFDFIIHQIVTMPIYGKEALNICHPT